MEEKGAHGIDESTGEQAAAEARDLAVFGMVASLAIESKIGAQTEPDHGDVEDQGRDAAFARNLRVAIVGPKPGEVLVGASGVLADGGGELIGSNSKQRMAQRIPEAGFEKLFALLLGRG